MANPIFTPDFTIISACETTADWTTNAAVQEADIKKQGTYGIGGTCTASKPTNYYTPASAINILGSHLRLWINSILSANMETQSAGGLQFMVTDGSNTGYWNMLGSDTYKGGWKLLVKNTNDPVDTGVKPDLTAITEIGFRYNFATSPKNFQNTWFDYFVHGSGYSVTGGTADDPITWQSLATADANPTNGYGVIQKINGVYFINGGVDFSGVYFKDTGATIVYLDNPISADYYRLTLSGSGHFQMGNKIGSRGIQGCAINCPTNYPVHIDLSNAGIDNVAIYCTIFRNAAEIEAPVAQSGNLREFISSSFEECSGIYVSTSKFQYCNFVNADDHGVVIEDLDHDVTDSNFINCGHGVLFPSSGTYEFDNLQFAGSDGVTKYDFENASTGHIIVEAINTSNPQYYENTNGGTSEIVNSVYITITVKNSAGARLEGASVYIERISDRFVIANELTDIDGEAQATYNYLADTDILIRVRKSSPGQTRYFPIETTGKILSTGFTLTAVMAQDNVALT